MRPADFWDETPRLFVNTMQGVQLKAEREYDMAIAQQYHGARFNTLAQVGKLKSLSSYIGSRASSKKSTAPSAAIAFFHAMRAAGLPVEITKVERTKEPRGG